MIGDLLYALAAPFFLLAASAADIPAAVLTVNFNPIGLVSSQLLAQNFSTAPRLAQGPPEAPAAPATANLKAILINHKTCAEAGYHLTYRIVVRNEGTAAATDVVVQNQYPAGTTWSATPAFPTAVRPPDEHDALRRLLIWREPTIAPGTFVDYTFTVRVDGGAGEFVDSLTVIYKDATGAVKQALTDNRIRAGCQAPPDIARKLLEPAQLQKQQVNIFCDVTKPGCTPILPKLGINFERAKEPARQVRICGPNDAGCVPNRPELGVRFREAIADIIPGDCRVLSDNIISTPDFQDALNRRSKPSAFYLAPLYEAGQDFRKLVLENALLGIGHTRNAQRELQDLDTAGKVAAALQRLQKDYDELQTKRKEKFDPVAEKAVRQAIDSIQRACGGDQANNPFVNRFRGSLPIAKAAYEANLDARTQAYRNMQQIFLQQSPAKGRQAFDELFARTFVAHQKEDEASDNRVRLAQWELALDTPKEAATACEAENIFAAPVESSATWCESNNYAQLLVQGAPQPEKAKQGLIAPPDIANAPPVGGREPAAGVGASCRGLPGDPWWAADCSCQCGQPIPGAEGTIRNCQDPQGNTKRITRHDIFVTSREECLADGPKHADPFF